MKNMVHQIHVKKQFKLLTNLLIWDLSSNFSIDEFLEI
jgi:hypothetical protein